MKAFFQRECSLVVDSHIPKYTKLTVGYTQHFNEVCVKYTFFVGNGNGKNYINQFISSMKSKITLQRSIVIWLLVSSSIKFLWRE